MILRVFFLLLGICTFVDSPADELPTPSPQEALAEYARQHRVGNQGMAAAEITDETVARIAGESTSPRPTPLPTQSPTQDRGKAYWVQGFHKIKDRMSSLETQLLKVKEGIPELWERFYHEDDPRLRTEVLGPQLQGALESRQRLSEELREAKKEFRDFKIAARKAGALPGWFRSP